MLFRTPFEVDTAPCSTAGISYTLLAANKAYCESAELEEGLKCNLPFNRPDHSHRILEQEALEDQPGVLGLLPGLAARSQEEGESQSHLPAALTSQADSQLTYVGSEQELFPSSFIFVMNCGPQKQCPSSPSKDPGEEKLRGGWGAGGGGREHL